VSSFQKTWQYGGWSSAAHLAYGKALGFAANACGPCGSRAAATAPREWLEEHSVLDIIVEAEVKGAGDEDQLAVEFLQV
jgi:hypothetical protein